MSDRPTSRRFTAEYTARILQHVDEMRHGEVGAFLRREGLYASHITEWIRVLSIPLTPPENDEND